jgi:signal transduction histidine kinase
MIESNLFKRHYLISVITIVVFLILGVFAQDLIMRATAPTPKEMIMRGPSFEFYVRLMHDLDPKDPVHAMKRFEELNQNSLPFRFAILNPEGEVIYPEEKIPVDVEKSEGELVSRNGKVYPFEGVPSKFLYIEFVPRHPPGGPAGPPGFGVRPGDRGPPPPGGRPGGPGGPPLKMILILAFVQITCVILGAGFSVYMLFRSLKAKAILADNVLAELQKGNLKARFPVTKMDEIGQAMSRFNKMADEIERVVEHMKQVEKSRISLLQDLTHDLRTPIASLKNLLETIESKNEQIDRKVLAEFMGLAVKEVDYFDRLVEDLLIIAQMSEPKYQLESSSVSLLDLLEEEIETVLGKSHEDGKTIQLINETGDDEIRYAGDAHLLKRLFRNGIENAHSFANSKTLIRAVKTDGAIRIQIEDDGPGFPENALASFGTRKMTRVLSSNTSGRLSVGLGSVIMKTVASLHRGSLEARNRLSTNGKTEGASVSITLPT